MNYRFNYKEKENNFRKKIGTYHCDLQEDKYFFFYRSNQKSSNTEEKTKPKIHYN